MTMTMMVTTTMTTMMMMAMMMTRMMAIMTMAMMMMMTMTMTMAIIGRDVRDKGGQESGYRPGLNSPHELGEEALTERPPLRSEAGRLWFKLVVPVVVAVVVFSLSNVYVEGSSIFL